MRLACLGPTGLGLAKVCLLAAGRLAAELRLLAVLELWAVLGLLAVSLLTRLGLPRLAELRLCTVLVAKLWLLTVPGLPAKLLSAELAGRTGGGPCFHG